MSLHIEITRADITCLANRLRLDSDLRYKLLVSDIIPNSGLPARDSKQIDCDEGEARALLRIGH